MRLHFAEPEEIAEREREFDVLLGNQAYEVDLDVISESGRPRRSVVREYRNVMLQDHLTITFKPKSGQPIISGVEIIREE